jgi:murein DD-endopeptidase MepM/ murein hydrolase activator NlpD
MRAVVTISRRRSSSRLVVLTVMAAGFAGCSADTSRFSNPNSSPYVSRSSAPAEVTGSVQAVPTSQISSQPLPPPPYASRPATVATTGVSGGGQGMGSYNPAPGPMSGPMSAPMSVPAAAPVRTPMPAHASLPPAPARDITGSVPAQQAWSWDGGTVVRVGPGDTAESLSVKYGVPASAILQANNLTSPALAPGQRIVIPRYNYAGAAPMPASQAPAVRPSAPYSPAAPAAPAATVGANIHIVAPGETLTSIAKHYHKPIAQLAAANNIAPHTHVRIGDRILIPGKLAAVHAAPPVAVAAPKVAVAAPKVAPPRLQPPAAAPPVTTAEAVPAARVAQTGPQATAEAGTNATASAGAPAFRWPLRGRVIAGFGQKPNGQQNDGIDLAVPEGTAIRAAEDGVVAYAGNELKGYGNLILVRHANGFVTAYANTSEIMVKRNDPVRRGQVIAKSGQSGTVTAPQLHFEIRKGASPVDPAQYLPSGA